MINSLKLLEAGFDILIKVDQNIPKQQNLTERTISSVIPCALMNRLRDLERLIPTAVFAINSIGPGEVVRIK